MIVGSQIKFWVFGAVGAYGGFLVLDAITTNRQFAIGAALVGGAICAMILGTIWNVEKDGEQAATYRRQARDEEARQAFMNVMAKGAKQLEAPKPQAVE